MTFSYLLLAAMLLAGCTTPPEADNAVAYEADDSGNPRGERTVCDFQTRAEFQDFVSRLAEAGTPHHTYVAELLCERE